MKPKSVKSVSSDVKRNIPKQSFLFYIGFDGFNGCGVCQAAKETKIREICFIRC